MNHIITKKTATVWFKGTLLLFVFFLALFISFGCKTEQPAITGSLVVPPPVPVIPPAVQAAIIFVHPGGVNNKADLDYVKTKIVAGAEPWSGKFNELKVLATAGTNTSATGLDENGQKADGRKAYANALSWYFTGNVGYANNAIGILKMWANTFNGYTVPVPGQGSQAQLNAAWIGALLGPAAEILRGYTGWATTDIGAVQNMFRTKFYPALNQVSSWNGNVDLTQVDAMMNLAIFNDDTTEFNLGLQRFRIRVPAYFYLASDGIAPGIIGDGGNINKFWNNPLMWVDGITQETCRDNNHHAQYAMASAIHAAEVAWNQGVDIYTSNTKRFSAVLELMATQLLSGSMQGICSDNVTNKDIFNTWEVGYNHYHNRKGISLPNTEKLIMDRIRPYGQSDWNIFYETLTHAK
jgi:hypothetical protein